MAVKSILFVCTGNTCRSPMAEALFRHMAGRAGLDIRAESRGLGAAAGMPMTPQARDALQAAGVPAGEHRAAPLRREDVARADLILVMTENHRRAVLDAFPDAKGKTHRLKEYAGGSPEDALDIEDPLGGSPSDYEKCRIEIQNALLDVIAIVKPPERKPAS